MRVMNLNKVVAEGKDIVVYPYRSAMVAGIVVIHAESDEEMRDYRLMQKEICKKVTKMYNYNGQIEDIGEKVIEPDNHVVYQIGDMYLMFSDWTLSIGMDIKIGRW